MTICSIVICSGRRVSRPAQAMTMPVIVKLSYFDKFHGKKA
jgi:hypothetical protein